MSIKKTISIILFSFIFNAVNAEENLKSMGKFKDWETFILKKEGEKICFAQSIPVVRAPKKLKRNPFVGSCIKFFIFRPYEFDYLGFLTNARRGAMRSKPQWVIYRDLD